LVLPAVLFALVLTPGLAPDNAAASTRAGRANTENRARATRAASVTERDFHITAPEKVRAGDVVLHVRNLGPDDHELIVVRAGKDELPLRADGLTVDEEKLEPRTVGGLEAGLPGSRRTLRVHLKPGRYEMFCNMSGHYLGGMEADLEVSR